MKINNLWYLCISIRLIMILLYKYVDNKKYSYLLLIIGLGFTFKALTGSNNEYQIDKVFWHDTRIIHAVLFILSANYLYNEKITISMILLFMSVLFSILYRTLV
jgi:hypothetical protein